MRVAFVTHGLPGEGYHGGAVTCWAIVKGLQSAGHQTTVISLFDATDRNPYLQSRGDQEEALRSLGAQVTVIEYSSAELGSDGEWRKKIQSSIGTLVDPATHVDAFLPWAKLAPRVHEVIRQDRYDGMLCYHFDALSAAYRLNGIPKMAAVGDLWHLPGYFGWWQRSVSIRKYTVSAVFTAVHALVSKQLMREMLRRCRKRGAFPAHYADWLRRHGFPDTLYLRTPVSDAVGADWAACREKALAARGPMPYKILLIGDLGTTSTASGLREFARVVIPRLEVEFGRGGFELHLVGGGRPAADLGLLLEQPYVKLRGRIVPADPEFLSSDLMVVPTSIPLGIRVRIITAWSFGCPVVAHRANAAGIPELAHGENALLAECAGDLAREVVRALRQPELRAYISANGRKTYEQYFAEDVAARRIVDELEALV